MIAVNEEANMTNYERQRDAHGRYLQRKPDESSKYQFNSRLTSKEYQLIERARAMGIDPRDVLVKALKEVVDERA